MKKKAPQKVLSSYPAVHRVASQFSSLPQGILVRIARDEINRHKKTPARRDQEMSKSAIDREIQESTRERIEKLRVPALRRVINATGVILHTGLGRAPFSAEAKSELLKVVENYCNIEVDVTTGERGERAAPVEEALCLLTGAEAAAVVNNNAAAVLILLNSLAFQKEVIISRGELIEIGGSFRLPEVMEKSGVVMREVGTTNKTHPADFERAVSKRTALLMQVHTSNYRVLGFTRSLSLEELIVIGKKHKLPVAQDAGGGALVDLEDYGLPHEPVIGDSIKAGADVVTFSGDKIMGGCQAGILVGRKKIIDRIKRNPLMRALRCDKMTYAVLEATLRYHLFSRTNELPVFKMLTEDLETIRGRAVKIFVAFRNQIDVHCQIVEADAQAGSGTLPVEKIPSVAVKIQSRSISARKIAETLRKNDPPIIGTVRGNALFLDMRTVREDEVSSIIDALRINF